MTIDLTGKKLLVVAPHLDDEVIGCGGLIQRVKAAGGQVYVMFLSVGATQNFGGAPVSTAQQRIAEARDVAQFLKFDGWRVVFEGDDYHLKLDQVPQKDLIGEIERGPDISLERIRPDIIAFPAFGDYNQDHRAASAACLAACRPAPASEKYIPDIIMSYESPVEAWVHPAREFRPSVFVELSDEQLETKLTSLDLYKSQVRTEPHPRSRPVLEAHARLRGAMIGTTYAEAYFSHKVKV